MIVWTIGVFHAHGIKRISHPHEETKARQALGGRGIFGLGGFRDILDHELHANSRG